MLKLRYGHGTIDLELDGQRYDILGGNVAASPPLTDAQIGDAFDDPIGSPPLGDVVSAGDSVLIVVSDATRETGSAQIVNLLVRRLIQAGVAPPDLRIIFATGTHRAVTAEEQRTLITPFIAQRVTTLVHDALDEASLSDLGETIDGVPIRVNRALREFDRVITVSGIGFHYFAGFSGGRKSICPGLTWAETIKATHKRALDLETGARRAGVGTGSLDGNAVNEACEQIAELIAPAFGINTVINDDGKVTAVYPGHWREAHRRGCADYLAANSAALPARRDLVIVSAGGYPYDINLIQAHKAMEMASYACNEGGDIVLVAECSKGLGRADFLKWFDSPDSRALAARLRTGYEINGQTAWSLLQKAERFRIHLISALPDEQVSAMGLNPLAPSSGTIADLAAGKPAYVLSEGARLLPVVAKGSAVGDLVS